MLLPWQESVERLWEFSWSSLEVETQPSIRHMLEWLIVWAMYRHRHLRHKIWALFEKVWTISRAAFWENWAYFICIKCRHRSQIRLCSLQRLISNNFWILFMFV